MQKRDSCDNNVKVLSHFIYIWMIEFIKFDGMISHFP